MLYHHLCIYFSWINVLSKLFVIIRLENIVIEIIKIIKQLYKIQIKLNVFNKI